MAKDPTSPLVRLESLNEGHIAALVQLEKEINKSPWSERSFRNELNHREGVFQVAVSGGKVVGFGGLWMVIDEAHVTTLAVDEKFRRQGLGMRIMVELLQRAQESGMTCSTLEVRAGNEAAIKLYEKLGYSICARRKGYYPDNREDALVMWKYDLDKWKPN